MRVLAIFSFICIFSVFSYSQTPEWVWAKGLIGSSIDRCHTIELDRSDNVYITGAYASSSLDFGATSLPNAGSYDIFVAKYDSSGMFQWAIDIGGNGEDESWDIITDTLNNVYVTGYFKSTTCHFGSDTSLNKTGIGTLFLAKYDSLGNFIWAKAAAGSGREWGRALGIDNENNVYLGGNFIDGDMTLDDTTLYNQGSYDMFVTKFKPNGDRVWTRHTGTSGLDLLRNLVTTPQFDNIYVLGDFNGVSISFDTTTLNNSSSDRDNFIVKYDKFGDIIWARQISGDNNEYGCYIAVDWKENIYITGQFDSEVCSFDGVQLFNTGTEREAYLAMYDYDGVIGWAKGFYGDGDDVGYSITSDMSDGIYVCGWFNSSNFNIDTDYFFSSGDYDMYISKFDYQGNYFWTKQGGDNGADFAECLISDSDGNLYVTGKFTSSLLDFDDLSLSNTGNEDVFIGKLSEIDTSTNIDINPVNNLREPFYPNPASSEVILNQASDIRLYSSVGKLIYSGRSDKLATSEYPAGFYLIVINDKTYKLIIK